jgi:hypothetical protein
MVSKRWCCTHTYTCCRNTSDCSKITELESSATIDGVVAVIAPDSQVQPKPLLHIFSKDLLAQIVTKDPVGSSYFHDNPPA